MIFFELFSRAPEIVRLSAGQKLFCEGDHGSEMYVLIRGQASVSIGGRALEALQPGNIVGEMALISAATRSATVTASEDCEFVVVNEARFHELVRQHPEFALHVMRTLTERLRRADLSLHSAAT